MSVNEKMTAIADAIREKTGVTGKLSLDDMAEKIRQIGASFINTAKGNPISLTDSLNMKLQGLKLFGRTNQEGTPNPDAPVPFVSAGDAGNIVVSIGVSETDNNPQTLTVSTPNGLPGVRVLSDGNYIDENGQQWICDEVDFERGVYIQRTGVHVSDGTESIFQGGVGAVSERIVWDVNALGFQPKYCIPFCNTAPGVDGNDNAVAWGGTDTVISCSDTVFLYRLSNYGITLTNNSEARTWLASRYAEGKPVIFVVARAEPIESPLSTEELAAYAVLHTCYTATTILNDSGAGMEVSYAADPKQHIDNQVSTLAASIVSGL